MSAQSRGPSSLPSQPIPSRGAQVQSLSGKTLAGAELLQAAHVPSSPLFTKHLVVCDRETSRSIQSEETKPNHLSRCIVSLGEGI